MDGILRAFSPPRARGAELAADRFDRVVTTTRFAAQELARIGMRNGLTARQPAGHHRPAITGRRRP